MMVLSTAITITVSDHLKILRIFLKKKKKTDEKTEAQKISKVKSLH